MSDLVRCWIEEAWRGLGKCGHAERDFIQGFRAGLEININAKLLEEIESLLMRVNEIEKGVGR